MALSELEAARISRAVGTFIEAQRPPAHIRPELDLGFRLSGQSVVIFEVRPAWKGGSGEKLERPVAKATYVRVGGLWRVYWMRQDLKWHRYDPKPEVASVEDFLALVREDRHACFFG